MLTFVETKPKTKESSDAEQNQGENQGVGDDAERPR